MKPIRLLLVFVVTALTGCSTSAFLNKNHTSLQTKQAQLLSFHHDNRFIYFDVVSRGCTFVSHFEVTLADKASNSIEVIQKKDDLCQVKPIKLSMAYKFGHLGVDTNRPIKVLNKVSEKLAATDF
jgi:hypothetical protein